MLLLSTLFVAWLLLCSFVPRDPTKTLFLGALIGLGGSLIKGVLDRKSQKKANAANSPAGQVAQWEAAGINPAFGVSQGAYIPQRAVSMGDSFAEAGSIFGNAVQSKIDEKIKETETQKENTKLRKELDKLSKPSAPSEYHRYSGVLPLPSAHSMNTSLNPAADPSEVLPPKTRPVAGAVSYGESAVKGPETGPGLTRIQNDFGSIVVPGADGEPWGIDEVATATVVGAPQVIYQGGKKVYDAAVSGDLAKQAKDSFSKAKTKREEYYKGSNREQFDNYDKNWVHELIWGSGKEARSKIAKDRAKNGGYPRTLAFDRQTKIKRSLRK